MEQKIIVGNQCQVVLNLFFGIPFFNRFKDIHIKLKCLYTKQKKSKKALSFVLLSYVAKRQRFDYL